MLKKTRIFLFSFLGLAIVAPFALTGETQQAQTQRQDKAKKYKPFTQTKASQAALKPADALQMLKEGNRRFAQGELVNRDLRAQIKETSTGQFPYAVILSCQDSRTSSDLMFDLNKGDAFSLRIAGNVINEDILGGMEFGTKVSGAKLIAVVGHNKCGAIYGACDDVKLGNLTGLLDKIKPAVAEVPMAIQPRNSKNPQFVERVTEANVRLAMRQITERSPIIKEMVDAKQVMIVGGVYDISTGKVMFFEN